MGASFSASVQTCPGTQSSSFKTGTGFLFWGVKLPRRGVNHPPPTIAEGKEKVKLYLYSSSGPSWPVFG